jgi:hypothetical protein
MPRFSRCFVYVVAIVSVACCANRESSFAGSITITPGYDEVVTLTAYLKDPASSALIPFKGVPLNTFNFPGFPNANVGSTDTIIERTGKYVSGPPVPGGANLTLNEGQTGTMNLEVIAVSLKSMIQDSNGKYLYASLDSAAPSKGTIDITYNGAVGNGLMGGTWINDFTMNLLITEGSPTGTLVEKVQKHFLGHGAWVTTPGPDTATVISGLNSDSRFWLYGAAQHDAGDGSQHVVRDVTHVPEPSGVGILMSGAAICGLFAGLKRRRALRDTGVVLAQE